jgi:hypothetical protein
MQIGYWWESHKDRDHWEDQDVDALTILKWILEIYDAVFSMSSALSSGGTTGLCNPFLINGLVNTLPHKQ